MGPDMDWGAVLKSVAQSNPGLVPLLLFLFVGVMAVRGVWRIAGPRFDRALELLNVWLEQAVIS